MPKPSGLNLRRDVHSLPAPRPRSKLHGNNGLRLGPRGEPKNVIREDGFQEIGEVELANSGRQGSLQGGLPTYPLEADDPQGFSSPHMFDDGKIQAEMDLDSTKNWFLQFDNPVLELAYQLKHHEEYIQTQRGILAVFILGSTGVSIAETCFFNAIISKEAVEKDQGEYEPHFFCDYEKDAVNTRRWLHISAGVTALVWFALTYVGVYFPKYKNFYLKRIGWLPSLLFMIWGCLILFISVVGMSPNSAPYIILFFLAYNWLLTYKTGCIATWSLIIAWIICTETMGKDSQVERTWKYWEHKKFEDLGPWPTQQPSMDPASQTAAPTTEPSNGFFSSEFFLEHCYLIITNILLTYGKNATEGFDRDEFVTGKQNERQQKKVTELLDNLLPSTIQLQMKQRAKNMLMSGKNRLDPIAEEREDVSILFSDIKGFTKYCSKVSAETVIFMLNDLYTRFDGLCSEHQVYKVETIGDAYFVSANCPDENDDHVFDLIQMGRAMINECTKIKLDPDNPDEHVKMRIGIHTGSVYAGVVGMKMPRYHLFGETVMIAEQMESSGKPGFIQISASSKEALNVVHQRRELALEEKFAGASPGDTTIELQKVNSLSERFNSLSESSQSAANEASGGVHDPKRIPARTIVARDDGLRVERYPLLGMDLEERKDNEADVHDKKVKTYMVWFFDND